MIVKMIEFLSSAQVNQSKAGDSDREPDLRNSILQPSV